MLSLFPTLLSWEQLSPLLIRLVLGVVFLYWAYGGFKMPMKTARTNSVAGLQAVVGILLVIGLWTQLAAIVAAIYLLVMLIERARNKAFLTNGVNYYLVLLVLALSLIVTGAGWFSFDLPL